MSASVLILIILNCFDVSAQWTDQSLVSDTMKYGVDLANQGDAFNQLVNDVPGEVFAPPLPLSPRSELISKLDPLDVLKSEEYIISDYSGHADKADPPRKECYVNFNDPASAAVSALLVCHQVTIDSSIRSDDEAVRHLLGNILPDAPCDLAQLRIDNNLALWQRYAFVSSRHMESRGAWWISPGATHETPPRASSARCATAMAETRQWRSACPA
jgi:hypothetical protein